MTSPEGHARCLHLAAESLGAFGVGFTLLAAAFVLSDISFLKAGSLRRANLASPLSAFSFLSFGSLFSALSILSIGSAGSILSIGSAGSILSIGSAGSILSIGSAGSILKIGRAGRA